MGLNESKGDMYPFIDFTWNAIKGSCPHRCCYCYMRRFGAQKPLHFDKRELKTDLGEGNYIFVGSSCDMWAESVESDWIRNVLTKCQAYDNRYLFQSKNPRRMVRWLNDDYLARETVVCTTIETNRFYQPYMGETVPPEDRVEGISYSETVRHITIEPIMDFDLMQFLVMIKNCEPAQVNIGADSGGHHLPEPPAEKVRELIAELEKFTTVVKKKNLSRIFREDRDVIPRHQLERHRNGRYVRRLY